MGSPVKIAIHTIGTRGDIQPFLALAIGLKARGHDVLMAAPSQFRAFIGIHGIGFAHLPGEFLELMETSEARNILAGSSGFSGGFKLLKKFKPIARRQLSAEWSAARRFKPQLIIHHPKAIGAPHIGDKLNCPTVLASPLPGFTPTSAFASPMVPFKSLGPLNPLTHSIMSKGGEALFKRIVADWRVKELELGGSPARALLPNATLYAYSPSVIGRPDDWPPTVSVTGYWFLDEDIAWRPSASLQQFLDAGEPPIYVGFGSMPGLDPEAFTRTIIAALGHAGKRGVLATGGGAIRDIGPSSSVHYMEGAPHDRLFPLVSACMHHGGAGTTAAALRAGKPQIICPFFGDQPFWGRQMAELGVAPLPIKRRRLSTSQLAFSMLKVTGDGSMQQRAMRLADKVRSEDGVEQAIRFLESSGLLPPPSHDIAAQL